MYALLKDRTTRRCSLGDVYKIEKVVYEPDESALWLQLDVGIRYEGIEFEVVSSAHLHSLSPFSPLKSHSSKENLGSRRMISTEQYMSAYDVAKEIFRGSFSRKGGIAKLAAETGLNEGSASALINNYRCLMTGTPIKAPMSVDAMEHFTDNIVATHGGDVLRNVVLSLRGFVQYQNEEQNNRAHGMRGILDRLESELNGYDRNRFLEEAIRTSEPGVEHASNDPASEILREIWVRGPQHAAFRRALKRQWNNTCAVHGVPCNDLLRASHIVAWRLSESLRGDVNNGLLLSVPLDSLFDCGLIAFSASGQMLLSGKLTQETMAHFGLRPGMQLAWSHLSETTRSRISENLAKHRAMFADQHGYT
ncbi:hypothetical protein C2U69_24885 [Cupriavidus pinatubonensis]|nr:hypothetical protein C2U69_24885 [Cupriavidus pinatubonensis]